MNLKTPEYISGTCNIGGAEVRRRQVSGVIGAVLSVTFSLACIWVNAPKGVRSLVFIPLVVALTGWLQSRSRFCAAFGLLGIFNFGELGKATRIVEPDQRSRDRKRALVLLTQAVALSVVFTLVFTLIPA